MLELAELEAPGRGYRTPVPALCFWVGECGASFRLHSESKSAYTGL